MSDITTIEPQRREVGARLAAARKAKALVQDAVAAQFATNKGTVSAWEKGRGDPGIYRLRELARLYEVTTDSLLFGAAQKNALGDAISTISKFVKDLPEKEKITACFAISQWAGNEQKNSATLQALNVLQPDLERIKRVA